MKKIIKRIKNEPMLIVLLIILVCFMPSALFSAGESNKSAIVTAIGIDMVGQEYEVSLLTFIPTPNQTYLETDSVISGTGETVADAIMKAELTLGKKIGLSHAKTTVVSFGVLEKNVAKEIDYLSRVASLSENTVLICTDKTAKEFLEASQKLEKDVGLKLDQLIEYNTSNIYITDTTLETFYKGYYSENSSSILGFLTLEESAGSDSETGGSEGGSAGFSSASGGGSGGSGGGGAGMAGGGSGGSSGGNSGGSGGSSSGKASSGGQSTKQIKNAGDIVLLKHGKLVSKLTQQQLLGINIINPSSTNDVITIYHKGDGVFGDALLTYQVNTKRVMTATKFENGNPVFSANVVLGLDLVEGQKADGAVKNNTDLSDIPASIAQEIEREVKSRFADALKVLRENKTDVIGVREKFERDNRKAFRKFLEGLDDADDYLNHINFQLVVRVQPD